MRTERIKQYIPKLKDIRLKYDNILTDEEKLAISRIYNHLKVQLAREERHEPDKRT